MNPKSILSPFLFNETYLIAISNPWKYNFSNSKIISSTKINESSTENL